MIGFFRNLLGINKTSKGYFCGSPDKTNRLSYRFLRAETHNEAVMIQHKYKRILDKNEIIRFEDSGKFKVGDGVSFIEDLPYADTLPEEMTMWV